jgi:glucose-6-phosphate 1-dehydrogenase
VIDRLVLLGAAGDLATRHTLPALAHLVAAGRLPPALHVVGVGREPFTDATYRSLIAARLADHAPHLGAAHRSALVQRTSWVQADVTQRPDLRPAVGARPVIAYLALPPVAYAPAIRALQAAGIAAGSRLVVEKPFGQDEASARALSGVVHDVFPESDVFRADHFLYHQTVQDLLALRFASPLLEPVWTSEHVERVEITWEETADVAGRADFYDSTGALRDMVQSHLLQLLALVTMEVPASFDDSGVRDAKVAALRRVRALTPSEVAERTARGRYTAGSIDDQARRAYVEEPGVDPSRGTETHATVRLDVDVPRWRGVPFVLRTGKALGEARRHIRVSFRPPAQGALMGVGGVLSLEMGPDRMTLRLAGAGGAGLPAVVPVDLAATRARQPLPASARLLDDVLAGDPTFTVRDDETEQAWRIVDSVLAGWRTGACVLQDYPAGSTGPSLPEVGSTT